MKHVFWHELHGQWLGCFEELPLPKAYSPDEQEKAVFLLRREPGLGRASFAVSHAGQLQAHSEDYRWLNAGHFAAGAELPLLQRLIEARQLRAVNYDHPRWQQLLQPPPRRKLRLNLLAVGDVGGMLLVGLKLLGGDILHSIGIYDLNAATAERWEFELGQVAWPQQYDALPEVESISPEQLFDADVFVFCASAGVPPLTAGPADVRMAQYEKNSAIIRDYARQAAESNFGGLFAVVSDPVDQLCRAAYAAAAGGLFPEQIEGYGLGVMNARAAYYAKRDARFASFLSQGRAFGPHGEGLVIANSIEDYDDILSQQLTELALTANLRARARGFKPYIAPALSSGALSLLLTLRGDWHYSSTPLGRVWMGARNRRLPAGVETELLDLPDTLLQRLGATYYHLLSLAEGGGGHE